VQIEELDSSGGIVDWPGDDCFQSAARADLATGNARKGKAGSAQSYLLDAAELVAFAARWMERGFRRPPRT